MTAVNSRTVVTTLSHRLPGMSYAHSPGNRNC